jgi:NAD(P)-dependent dehydrogenase (short-subunit alcohol dehydrogenase family)
MDASSPSPTPPPLDVLAGFRLEGRVAVVTGASGGLGERFARVLHDAGAHVVAGARRLHRLEALADELERAEPVRCDVADDADRRALVEGVLARHGRIDVLVNNAGIGEPVPALEEDLEHFERVVAVNLTGLWRLSQLAGASMVAQGSGSIVNIASILGLVASAPIPQASYTASKGAVVNLTRELAVQWARKGVRVNALAPGWFPSDMTTTMFTEEASIRYLERNAPMGRGGEAHELDGALLFLASDASSYVTGHVLTVDGGWTAR